MSAENKIAETFSELIARFEGFSPVPYRDAKGWSIGYGHFIIPGDGFVSPTNPDGKKRVTMAEAKLLLDIDTAKARRAVDSNVKVPLTRNQYNALVSLTYNIGVGAFSGSTLVKLLNKADYAGAAAQFARWNMSEGQVNEVLVSRREQEARLFKEA